MQLFKANAQWKSRPADERFWNITELLHTSRALADQSLQASVYYSDLRVKAEAEDILLIGKTGQPAKLCHWAFGQLAQKAKAPAEYLRRLPPSLVEQNLNFGLATRDQEDAVKLLLHKVDGQNVARCLTSSRYQRIWNFEIAATLKRLEDAGWKTPPARPARIHGERIRKATEEDVLKGGKLGLSIKVGDDIAPAGIYASDRDCFVFMVDDDHQIENRLGGVPLARGFFCWNSEVGDKTFGIMTFLYDAVCGNHIVWGAQEVKELKFKHIGHAREKASRALHFQLREYANGSTSELEGKIQRAQTLQIASSKEDVLSQLLSFSKRKKFQMIGEKELEAAYHVVEENPRYGNPRTPWAITQGLTQLSQTNDYAGDRAKMDKEAGQILEIAF